MSDMEHTNRQEDEMTTYEMANATYNEVLRVYGQAQAAYRARLIGDDEFLAARATWKLGEAEFDAAFAAAQEG